jgi:hypothetical protein
MDPLVAQLPANSTMVTADVTSNFMAPMAYYVCRRLFCAALYPAHKSWSFVAPEACIRRKIYTCAE